MRLPFPNHCIQLVQVMLHFVDQLIQHFVCLFCLFFNGPGIRLLDGRFLGMPLFFSEQDNRDELATRLYIVVGRLQRPSPEIRARISNGGKFMEIPLEDVVEVSPAEFPEYWTASVAPSFTANRKGDAL